MIGEDVDVDNENPFVGVLSFVLVFSFSIILLFISLILIGGFNNFAIYNLLSVGNSLIADGVVHGSIATVLDDTASSFLNIISYLDSFWLISFIAMIVSSLSIAYLRKRENYFNILTMSTLGLIVILFIGSIFIQLTTWFRDEIMLKVFPTLSDITPYFSWYLDHIGIINIILLSLMILVNYVDLDFSKFNTRKDKEGFDEL